VSLTFEKLRAGLKFVSYESFESVLYSAFGDPAAKWLRNFYSLCFACSLAFSAANASSNEDLPA